MKSSSFDDETSDHPTNENEEIDNLEGDLSNFRDVWKKEIANEIERNNVLDVDNVTRNHQDDIEMQARLFFMEGAENEKKGRLYEAIQFYRKAVQLVPDIELKIFNAAKKQQTEDSNVASSANSQNELQKEVANEEDIETLDLCNRLISQSLYSKSFTVCVPAQEQRGAHFSSLPIEIILLIFRWIVSKDLDIRSLEMCSMVCRGFYLCSRDSEIWKLICNRSFGLNCSKLDNCISWRDTYLQKPHLSFTGCYISKASYFRQGEKCFQDQFHRPWHVVEYYRYLRFFPDGVVLMITTPDPPGPILNHLRYRKPKNPSILVGRFLFSDDRVSMAFQRNNVDQASNRRRGRNNRQSPDCIEQKYNIDLTLKALRTPGHSQLLWNRYTVQTIRGVTETLSNFDLPPSKFPPFWFSRVKSYSVESDSQL